MLEFLLRPSIYSPLLLLAIYTIYTRVVSTQKLPDLPWVGLRKEWFAKLRCRWRTSSNYAESLLIGYQNFSSKGLPFIAAKISSEVIILPPALMEWIISQPDEVLGAKEAHKDNLQYDYTFSHSAFWRARHEYHHEHIIKTDLTRQLGSLTMDIMDELSLGFDETWGLDTESWKSIGVMDSMRAIVARTSNRVFVGLPLCRNDSFLALAMKYAKDIPTTGIILHQIPSAFRPLLAPLITLPNKYHYRKAQQHLGREIQSRLSALDPEKAGPQQQPNDFVQWLINSARRHVADYPEELSADMIGARILAMNFAAIHTSTFSVTEVIFDLASSDPSAHYLEQLREEAASILAEDDGIWTKRGLGKMHKIDSALRESFRLRSGILAGMPRKVVAKDGVTTPEGVHLPCGVTISLPVRPAHRDEKIYPNPLVYDPFRFVKERDEIDAATGLPKDGVIQKANLFLASTSGSYLAFGHGRHACPGRFFAANELKLLLAYMVLNYDIEPLAERPAGKIVSEFVLPPLTATIRIKRRKM